MQYKLILPRLKIKTNFSKQKDVRNSLYVKKSAAEITRFCKNVFSFHANGPAKKYPQVQFLKNALVLKQILYMNTQNLIGFFIFHTSKIPDKYTPHTKI